MGEFTLTLFDVLKILISQNEQIKIQDVNLLTYSEIIERGNKYLFDFDFPFWKNDEEGEKLKEEFKTKFSKHFYLYEIAAESIPMFKLQLDEKLNLIMPYYNNYFKSELWFDQYIDNPANNTDYKEEYERTIKDDGSYTNVGKNEQNLNGTSNSVSDINSSNNQTGENNSTQSSTLDGSTNSTGTSNNEGESSLINKTSDTPQGLIEDLDYYSSASNDKSVNTNKSDTTQATTSTQASSGSQIDKATSSGASNEHNVNDTTSTTSEVSNNSNNGTNTNNTLEKYSFRRYGNIGVQTPGEVFESTRKAFINTTEMIFKECMDLFVLIY